MRLGISAATYAWIYAPPVPRDAPEYAYTGRFPFYFSALPISVPPERGLDWLIDHTAELGLRVLNASLLRYEDPAYVERIGAKLEATSVELVGAWGAQWVSEGEESRSVVEKMGRHMAAFAHIGGRLLLTTCGGRLRYSHFVTHLKSIDEQIALISENLKRVAELAEELNLTVALENHMDYRAAEIAAIVERVGSPRLRVNLDTANPFSVCEEPVEAARILAPYTVMMHLKDFQVIPTTQEGPRIFPAPLGRGHVDLERILAIVAEACPDPVSLPACLEVGGMPPEVDVEPWVLDSLATVRRRWPQHFGV
jgi:sugar phosphate isomerase/epimerase